MSFFNFVYKDFFNFNLLIMNVNYHVFYYNVYIFINKLKFFINFKNENKIHEILFIYFRDNVLI